MCGINAIYDPARALPEKAELIREMGSAMYYRGPDDDGAYLDATVALGMRRLSIIDVAGGHQPLFNETGDLAIVFNGEIYNYVELIDDLKRRGHQFRTRSDTEVILHLYEEKGEACVHDLRGMFAFVLWDKRAQRLFVARDRVGIKPLYMAQLNGALWLSSELKTIIAASGMTPSIRAEAAYQFLLYSHAIDPRHTMIEQITRVLPGEYLTADAQGVTLTRYWTPRLGGERGIADRSDTELLELLEEAVRLHLRSDVPVGILLSGGIDSSAVAALAARAGSNYTALCAGYRGNDPNDERALAHATAEALGLPHIDVILDAESYEADFDELVRYCDEPVGDPAAMPQWSLYRQARRQGFKVLLSGIGGDEIAFGYNRWNTIGQQSAGLTPEQYARWIGFDLDAHQLHTAGAIDALAATPLRNAAQRANQPLYELRDQAPQGPDAMAAMLFGSYLLQNGCALTDKLSMGCSVELRVPLLDHALVEAVFGLPLAKRFEPGQSKALLRRLLRGVVPDAVLDAPKRGFTPPGQYADSLATRRIEQVRDGYLARSGLVDRSRLQTLCTQHAIAPWLRVQRLRNLIGIPKSITLLFRMVAFECWYNTIMAATPAGKVAL
jgi:asparagine synthase (glutamine-hydrolysing)